MVAKSMSISMLLAGVPASLGQRTWESLNEQLEEAIQQRQLSNYKFGPDDFNDYCELSNSENMQFDGTTGLWDPVFGFTISGESTENALEFANGLMGWQIDAVHGELDQDGNIGYGAWSDQTWADVGAWGKTVGEMENSVHALGNAGFGSGNLGHQSGEVCVTQIATTTSTATRTTATRTSTITTPWPTPAPTPACPTPAPGANTATWILSDSGASCTEACKMVNEPCNECGMKAVTVNKWDSLEHISNRLACKRSFCANVFEGYNPSIDSADMCCWAGQNSTCDAKKENIKRLCCCGTQCELPDNERYCLPPCKVKPGWCDCKTNDISNTPQGATPVLALSMVISMMVLFRASSFFS